MEEPCQAEVLVHKLHLVVKSAMVMLEEITPVVNIVVLEEEVHQQLALLVVELFAEKEVTE